MRRLGLLTLDDITFGLTAKMRAWAPPRRRRRASAGRRPDPVLYVDPSYAMRLIQEHSERVVDALRRIVDGETVIDPTIVSRRLGRRCRRPRSPTSARGNERCSG
jgi:hypothetical protein